MPYRHIFELRLDTSRLINEHFYAPEVAHNELDRLWSLGWRHFGSYFFRYNIGILQKDVRPVLPLRIDLSSFTLSKSQKRVLRKNTDVEVRIGEPEFGDATHELFRRHASRFSFGKPDSIYTFLGHDGMVTEIREFSVFVDGRLAAISYLDIGADSVSSIYAMFEPEFARRSLGIFTLLNEIEFAQESEKQFLYQGYAYLGESFYDYKKQFSGSEYFDWFGNWHHYSLDLEK